MVKDEKVKSVFETMGPTLHAAIDQALNTHSEEEAELLRPVNLFDSPNQWHKYHCDIKMLRVVGVSWWVWLPGYLAVIMGDIQQSAAYYGELV